MPALRVQIPKVTGLFSEDDFREIKERYDTDGDGAVDMVEFLELVTPEGPRAMYIRSPT